MQLGDIVAYVDWTGVKFGQIVHVGPKTVQVIIGEMVNRSTDPTVTSMQFSRGWDGYKPRWERGPNLVPVNDSTLSMLLRVASAQAMLKQAVYGSLGLKEA